MRPVSRWLTLTFLAVLGACSKEPQQAAVAEVYDPARDYFTFSNYEQVTTRHIALDLDVDFDRKQLAGYVTLHMSRLDPAARSAVFQRYRRLGWPAQCCSTGPWPEHLGFHFCLEGKLLLFGLRLFPVFLLDIAPYRQQPLWLGIAWYSRKRTAHEGPGLSNISL